MGSESKRNSLPLAVARIWQGPLAPQALPCFPATMGLADSRPEPRRRLCLPAWRWALCPPRRVSQVPRLILRRAPSPTTPESPAGAHTHYFPTGSRLHHHWQVGHSRFGLTRPKRVHLITAHVCAARGSAPRITPTHARWASWRMGNSHGKLLSACGINQALPGAPRQSSNRHGHKV